MRAPRPLEEQLCFSLYSAVLAVTRAYKPLLDALGLTYPQYLVLLALWEEDGRSPGSVASRLGLEPSTVTPLVKRLEASGLVRRERDGRDERKVRIHVTARGLELQDPCACLAEALAARSGLTPEALVRLNRDVQALRNAIQDERR